MMQFDEFWDYGQPDETRLRFLPLLDTPNAAADVDYRAQLMTQIARTHSLQGQFAAAHAQLDTVEALLPELLAVTKARYYLERGRTHNSAGEKAQARELFSQALAAAEEAAAEDPTADYHVVDAMHMLGIAEAAEKQIEWSLKGLEHTEKSRDTKTKKWLGPLYNNVGWSYHDAGEYKKALAMFQKGWAVRKKQGEATAERIAQWTVGRALRSLERYWEAYRLQADLLDQYQREGQQSGYVYEELAECSLLLGFPATGRAYAHLAYQELSQDSWLIEHEGERLGRLQGLAKKKE